MKANEAPEKLYIDFRDRAESTWRCAYNKKVMANNIEYIRTDAFIEKAVDWITRNGSYYVGFEQGQPCIDKEFIDNFKTAMMK